MLIVHLTEEERDDLLTALAQAEEESNDDPATGWRFRELADKLRAVTHAKEIEE
jgi:hypothetical protein